jgi:hypothetical protein
VLPGSMKAVQFYECGEPSVLRYLDVPMPKVDAVKAHEIMENRQPVGRIILVP